MNWKISSPDPNIETFSQEISLHPAVASVLLNRGFTDKDAAEKYLNISSKKLPDAYLINDFEKALALLSDAVKKGKNIYIYGDYDADGVMSTVILYRALCELGADVHFYVPHRIYDGYGLSTDAVERIAGEGCEMLITCDNGIAAADEIKLAKNLGMQVIILDHHEPIIENGSQILPPADAVVDCKRLDNTYPFRDMCAGGLCYRFVKEFYKYINQKFTLDRELITFAGIATVCDIVSLRSDNRIIVKNAIYLLNTDVRNLGLKALLALLVRENGKVTTTTVGFNIGPCINAVGRLEAASEAVKLFITNDLQTAEEYAALLVQKNAERKEITAAAAKKLMTEADLSLAVQVLYAPDAHESVAGLIASRIKEKFYRPTLVITDAEVGCKGSGRSVEEYDMYGKMSVHRDLFTKFGGHAMACGFSIPRENIDKLRTALNETCGLDPNLLKPSLKIDYCLPFDELNIDLAYQLDKLEPFGKDNEKPYFCTYSVNLCSVRFVGQQKNTVQLAFSNRTGKQVRGIIFNGTDMIKDLLTKNQKANYIDPLENGSTLKMNLTVDIAYSIDINTYKGVDYLQLNIADILY